MAQQELFNAYGEPDKLAAVEAHAPLDSSGVHAELNAFNAFGRTTEVAEITDGDASVPVYINEFWTARQRAAHSLHEISYRACFKPQLPRFFIQRLSTQGDIVYDPFGGRGTTGLEAALHGRIPVSCDVNPLSRILLEPRISPPDLSMLRERLESLSLDGKSQTREDLEVFFHPDTLCAITNLREYLLRRASEGALDHIDRWIRMVATNRLTGHSPGFFSVYTLPPNQATSVVAQKRINLKRSQTPPLRDIRAIILKKSRSLLSDLLSNERRILAEAANEARFLTNSADSTPELTNKSVQLVITSPPFLDVVNYRDDNWLRCWFNGIDSNALPIWNVRNPEAWQQRMTEVFHELHRVLVVGGWVAFEVGEVRGGKIQLEHAVIRAMRDAGLHPHLVLINTQAFTKTANCWGVDNNRLGTNSNRVVVAQKLS